MFGRQMDWFKMVRKLSLSIRYHHNENKCKSYGQAEADVEECISSIMI